MNPASPKLNSPDRWLVIFQAAGIVLLLIVSIRLFYLQVLKGGAYEARAEIQHVFKRSDPAPRGRIFDRNNRLLAGSMETEAVWVYTPFIKEDELPDLVTKLSTILGEDPATYYNLLTGKKKYVRVARHLNDETVQKLKEAGLKKLDFAYDPLRFYPNGRAAAEILGFCDCDSNGLESIEKQFDRYLKGKDGYITLKRDALGKPISTDEDSRVLARPGYDIKLTIDLWIQAILEEEMLEQCKKYNPSGAVGVVMSVKTGEVLAMASLPFFDPNRFSLYDKECFRNRAITDVYEPGSMAKGFTAAAVLENGIMTPETIIDCEGGRYRLHGRTVKDAGHHAYHDLTLAQVVAKSSNVGAAKMGEEAGKELMYDMLKRFGMTEHSGIGLWGELCPRVYPVSKWSKQSVGSISFGYEFMITPISLARAYCAIANEGLLPPAKLIDSITDNDNRRINFTLGDKVPQPRNVISAKTSRQLCAILREVVTDGTCKVADIPEYKIAGKTGTAIKCVNGSYSWNTVLGSFIGFAPLDNPEIVVLVSIDEPHGAQYGGTVAGPAVKDVILRSLRYLGIPEDCSPGN